MAKSKPSGEAPKPARNSTTRTRRDKEQPADNENPQQREDLERETPNPEWWRGDPGKRGEVL
jgi:hypothetical protein